MAVINSTVYTEEPYFQSNCDITSTLSISRYLVSTGFSKKNNITYFDEYSENRPDTRNKFRRAKRSENNEHDYALKSFDFIEPLNELNKLEDNAKKDNDEYSNNMYDYNYNSKLNAHVGKYYIDEPDYLVKGKYLSTLTHSDNSLYLSKSTCKNIPKQGVKDIQLTTIQSDILQIDYLNNLHKNEHTKLPKQNVLTKPKIKLNILEEDKSKNYDLLKYANEAQYQTVSNNYYTPIYKPQNVYRVENADQPHEANGTRDANKYGTNTLENVKIKESLVKQKHKREKEEKYMQDEYGSVNTLMIESAPRLPSGDDIFAYKQLTYGNTEEQKTPFTKSGLRQEEANLYRKYEAETMPENTTTRQLAFGKNG